jgi:hypothetical protein
MSQVALSALPILMNELAGCNSTNTVAQYTTILELGKIEVYGSLGIVVIGWICGGVFGGGDGKPTHKNPHIFPLPRIFPKS